MVPNATDYAGGTHNSLLETARSGASRASDSSILAYDRLARSLHSCAIRTHRPGASMAVGYDASE